MDEQLSQKRQELTQAQIAQTNAYSDYMKVMKAKSIVSESDTEKNEKLDKFLSKKFVNTQRQKLEEINHNINYNK